MTDIFLSYSHEDKSRVERIAKALGDVPLRVWWDRNLSPGDNFGMEIEKKIDEARHVLVAWSSPARVSLYVRGEALEALDQNKLIQVMLDGSRIPVPFNAVHTVFLDDWKGDVNDAKWRELVQQLTAGGQQGHAPKDVLRAGASASQKISLWLAPVLVALPIAAGAGAWWAYTKHLIPPQQIELLYLAVGGASVAALIGLTLMLLRTAAAAFKDS